MLDFWLVEIFSERKVSNSLVLYCFALALAFLEEEDEERKIMQATTILKKGSRKRSHTQNSPDLYCFDTKYVGFLVG